MEELQYSNTTFEQFWEQMPKGGSCRLVVTGDSMRPTLRHEKDLVVLERISGKDARPYDIVLFRRNNGSWVLHRLLKKQGSLCTMNGDGQVWTETAEEAAICARVTAIWRGHRREIKASSRYYRCYVHFWAAIRRFRPLLFRARARWKRMWKGKKKYI